MMLSGKTLGKVLRGKGKAAVYRLLIAVVTVVVVSTQSVAAFTQDDFSCLLKGGPDATGGNCFYQPNPTCTTSAGATDSTPDASSGSGGSAGSTTIVLDPGHAPHANELVDPATNLPVFDYENDPEMEQVWKVAQAVKTQLQQAGYTVLLTKSSLDDTSTNLKKRAEVGNQANAALGVSLHTTPGTAAHANNVFYPAVGNYVATTTGKHDVYSNSQLANTDQADARTMAQDLQQTEGQTWHAGTYDNIYGPITRVEDGVTMAGTMLTTQYFAKIPWVYAEQAQDVPSADAVSSGLLSNYEAGVVKGVEDIVPVSGSSQTTSTSDDTSTCACTSSSVTLTGGDNRETIFNYFVGKGLTPVQAAGIDGNFGQESGWNPNEPNGYLAQWTDTAPLAAFAQQEGKPITDLGVQLDFIWSQLTSTDYASVLKNIKAATTVEDATNAFTGPEIYPGGAPAPPYYEGQREGGYENPSEPMMTNRIKYAQQILQDYGGGAGGSSCGVGSPDCTTASGNTKILCEAEKYQGIYYRWDGGHQGIQAFLAGCPDPANPPNPPGNTPHGAPPDPTDHDLSGNPSPCATDCSGLVSIAVDEAFNDNYVWSVDENTGKMEGDGAQYWQPIPFSQASAGDIVTFPGHVEIVDHVSGDTVYSFGSHETGSKTGPDQYPERYWSAGAWRWEPTGGTT